MIDEKKRNELIELVTQLYELEVKEQKLFEVEMLHRYVNKLDKFYDLNKREVNKLMMLLEYTILSVLKKDDGFTQRYKALRRHATKYFKMYHEGELKQLGIGKGMAIGVSIGVALGSGFRNVALGIPIGISIGVAIGVGIGNKDEEKAKSEGRIL